MNFPKYRLYEETATGTPGAASAPDKTGQGDLGTNQDQQGQETASQGNWPGNWRELYAGADEKKLSRLSRYASPTAAIDAMIAAQNKISTGEFRAVTQFPDRGTDEEKTAWRTANGIPEAPDKYDFKLPDGVVLGENDKPIVDDLAKFAHERNIPNESLAAVVQWYMGFQEKRAEEMYANDDGIKQSTEDELRAEWGQDYRRNLNTIKALLDQAPEGVKDKFLGGRLSDGTPIGSDPQMLRYLASLALQINPLTTLVPGAGANAASAIEDEIGKLEGMMSNRGSEYWKGPNSVKNQQRYRDLVAARDKTKKTA